MKAALVLAALLMPVSAQALVEPSEQHREIFAQCTGKVGHVIYVAPLGSQSRELCRELLEHCANDAGIDVSYSLLPRRMPPPYRVCH